MDVSHINTALLKLLQKEVLHVGKLTAENNPQPTLAATLCHGNNVVHMIRSSRTRAAYGSFYIWLEKAKNSTPNCIPFLYCHLLCLFLFTGTFTCKAGFGIQGLAIRLQPGSCKWDSWRCYFYGILIDSKKNPEPSKQGAPGSRSAQPHDRGLVTERDKIKARAQSPKAD